MNDLFQESKSELEVVREELALALKAAATARATALDDFSVWLIHKHGLLIGEELLPAAEVAWVNNERGKNFGYNPDKGKIAILRRALQAVAVNGCWCPAGIGHPAFKDHDADCTAARLALEECHP